MNRRFVCGTQLEEQNYTHFHSLIPFKSVTLPIMNYLLFSYEYGTETAMIFLDGELSD